MRYISHDIMRFGINSAMCYRNINREDDKIFAIVQNQLYIQYMRINISNNFRGYLLIPRRICYALYYWNKYIH